ncbi:hypothetical protein MNV49_006168 [Pseudohyphozyma bogoriensis]|nr:hypothetical protein MNV49_006168 [Pseudohyphozyma bogoriensis]
MSLSSKSTRCLASDKTQQQEMDTIKKFGNKSIDTFIAVVAGGIVVYHRLRPTPQPRNTDLPLYHHAPPDVAPGLVADNLPAASIANTDTAPVAATPPLAAAAPAPVTRAEFDQLRRDFDSLRDELRGSKEQLQRPRERAPLLEGSQREEAEPLEGAAVEAGPSTVESHSVAFANPAEPTVKDRLAAVELALEQFKSRMDPPSSGNYPLNPSFLVDLIASQLVPYDWTEAELFAEVDAQLASYNIRPLTDYEMKDLRKRAKKRMGEEERKQELSRYRLVWFTKASETLHVVIGLPNIGTVAHGPLSVSLLALWGILALLVAGDVSRNPWSVLRGVNFAYWIYILAKKA